MQAVIPANISEEYYQISEAILASFPKYRPPLDLFLLKEDICQLQLLVKKDTRISNEQIELLATLCKEGNLFVSRADFPVYSKHIVKQLDLVLVDTNLKEGEVADITLAALNLRLTEFFEQPVTPVFEALQEAVQVVTEYLWQDRHRVRLYLRRLYTGEYSLTCQSLNSFSVGLWLFCKTRSEEMRRREFDRMAMGLIILNVGMSKLPAFILAKTTPLKPEEKEKIPLHPLIGIKIAQKLGIICDEIRGTILEHQERTDGSGYPQHLKGKDISRPGRLAAVAESFGTMIMNRPYATAMSPLEAAKALAADKARYDPQFTLPLLSAYMTNDFSF